MIKITFLGTSGSIPTRFRSLPSVGVEKEGEAFLFDCGEGAQRQAMLYSFNLAKIKAIFLTHTHCDHILGIAGLVRTLALNKRPYPLYIFVPKGSEKSVQALLNFDKALIKYEIIVKGIGSGKVYDGGDFYVSAFRLNHLIPTLGFLFVEKDKVRFIKEKCNKLGIKGTMFKELLEKGSLAVGRKKIKLKDVTFTVKGKRFAYATDSRPTESTAKAAKEADILVHETSYSGNEIELAKERYHCTAVEAARIAKKANCKKLLLFHISARYRDPELLLKEAKQIFKNSEIAKDGMSIVL